MSRPKKQMKVTPMMRQYFEAKEGHPDAILLFRMGDFYEMFFDDAETAARECALTLTARHKGEANETPMAGIPHHAAEGYIAKLVAKGYKVAICDQLESPQKGVKLVRRGVTRVITPGVVTDPALLDEKDHNYLAAIALGQGQSMQSFALAYIDASTGDFKATEVSDLDQLSAELSRVGPREVVVPRDERDVFEPLKKRNPTLSLNPVSEVSFDVKRVLEAIQQGDNINSNLVADSFFVDTATAAGFFKTAAKSRFRDTSAVQRAVAGALAYLIYTQRGVGAHIRQLETYNIDEYLVMDESTRANLELTETLMGGRRKGSLLHSIDSCVTAMGSRRLRSWLAYPLLDTRRIRRRHDAVGEFKENLDLRDQARDSLSGTYDIERLIGKVSGGVANARDLLQLRNTLLQLPDVIDLLAGTKSDLLRVIHERLDPCPDLCELLESALVDDPPTSLRDGGIIRRGYNDELDELIDLTEHGKDWLLKFEAEQRELTGISSLKVKYNKVFGYFIEVTKANLHLVPEEYNRRQTLTNSERFITPDLKEYEEKILNAEDLRKDLEFKLFEELRQTLAAHIHRLRHAAYMLSTLDVLAGLAEVAYRRNYCRPTVDTSDIIEIEEGRHPVVEIHLKGERFVPNSVHLDCTTNQLILITGPNMAGKSTVIRQVAIISLLSQIGSFVPASRAHLGVVDKIFSRVGASDNLVKGQSTFMVEMTETAHILANATKRSLIILDEIGRGTSTYDGLSIAWSVTEHIHDEIGAKTLFATHYHELTSLSEVLRGVQNFNIAAKEHNDDIVFLRKLVEGPASQSYGIQVGRLAGLPDTVVQRAKVILAGLDANDNIARASESAIQAHENVQSAPEPQVPQLDFFSRSVPSAPEPQPKPKPVVVPVPAEPLLTPEQLLDAPASAQTLAQPAPQALVKVEENGVGVTAAQREALAMIAALDVVTTTPLDAINLLYQIKKMAEK